MPPFPRNFLVVFLWLSLLPGCGGGSFALGLLEAFVSDDGIGLRWSAPQRSADQVDQYQVQRREYIGSAFAPIGSTVKTTFFDGGVSGDTTYIYKVGALNAEGHILGYSDEVSATARQGSHSICTPAVTSVTATRRWLNKEISFSEARWSRGQDYIAGVSASGFQTVVNAADGSTAVTFFVGGFGRFLGWSPDDELLMFGGFSALTLIRAQTGMTETTIEEPFGFISSASWREDGSRIAVGGSLGVFIWDHVAQALQQHLDAIGKDISAVAWRDAGSMLAAGNSNGSTFIVDVVHAPVPTFERPGQAVRDLFWIGAGNALAVYYSDQQTELRSGDQWTASRFIQSGVLSWDGRIIARAEPGRRVAFYDGTCGSRVGLINELEIGAPGSLIWSPESDTIVLLAADGTETHDIVGQ